MKVQGVLFSILFFASLFANITSAQIPGSDTADLDIIPDTPRPNQQVTARLQSYLTDLNKAQISWIVNGVTVDSGVGMKNFSFKTGPLGSRTELAVFALTEEGFPISRKIVLSPADVSLVYEAKSYTPPFYKGRAYFPYSGSARIIATPSFVDQNGLPIKTSDLIFKWKDGDKNLEDNSGYGRNILYYKNSNLIPKSSDIMVEVSNTDNSMLARRFLTLEPIPPKVVLYRNDPLYGTLFNKALGEEYVLTDDEVKISAIPYFFGVNSTNSSSLKYEWNLNGDPVNSYGSNLVLKKPSGISGLATLYLQISNTVDYFQFGKAQTNITFNR